MRLIDAMVIDEIINEASDGAIVCLSFIQEMVANHDERIFSSAILSRLEEVKTLIKQLNDKVSIKK